MMIKKRSSLVLILCLIFLLCPWASAFGDTEAEQPGTETTFEEPGQHSVELSENEGMLSDDESLEIDNNKFVLQLDGTGSVHWYIYPSDTNGDGDIDDQDDATEVASYNDIPCNCLYRYQDDNDMESGEIGYKEHEYSVTYKVGSVAVSDYENIPCGTGYIAIYTCTSCGDSFEYEDFKEHEIPEDGVTSNEESVSCGEIYVISYQCPQCEQTVSESFVKDHDYEIAYITERGTFTDYDELNCEETYVTQYTCSVCGYSYSDSEDQKDHEPNDEPLFFDEAGNIIAIDDLACETQYYEQFICAICEEEVYLPYERNHEADDILVNGK